MKREVETQENQPNRKPDSNAKEEGIPHGPTYWQDMNSFLNFSFAEHWLGLTIVACALCCFFIYLATINMHPLWWACIGTILFVDLIIFALFSVGIKRLQAAPTTAPGTPRTVPATATAIASPTISTSTDAQPGQQAQTTLPDGRLVVNVTPDFLSGFFRQHTSIQAKSLLSPYIGTWIKVSGIVQDTKEYRDATITVYLKCDVTNILACALAMSFSHKWKDRLTILTRGDHVTVLGQLQAADAYVLNLENCELL